VELRHGFNPRVATEAPDASVLALPAVRLTLFTVGSASFRLESSANLVDWLPEGAVIQGRNGYSERVLDAPDAARTYRLVPLATSP
jgi:hypothetical protein